MTFCKMNDEIGFEPHYRGDRVRNLFFVGARFRFLRLGVNKVYRNRFSPYVDVDRFKYEIRVFVVRYFVESR